MCDFDRFESDFYNYVDKIIDKDKVVEPINSTKPVVASIDKDRLNVLLYKAISCLEECGYKPVQLKEKLDITKSEYAVIMNKPESLESKISFAERQKFDNVKNNSFKDFNLDL